MQICTIGSVTGVDLFGAPPSLPEKLALDEYVGRMSNTNIQRYEPPELIKKVY
jgi:hypothetical protein